VRPALRLLAAAVIVPLLAGCAGPAAGPSAPAPGAVTAAGLEAGGYYAFVHAGGELALAMRGNGSADLVLYGADGARVSHVGLDAGQASGRFVLDGLPPQELVVEAKAVNGTLDIRSRGHAVDTFTPLPTHVERHVLLEARQDAVGLVGLPGTLPPAHASLDVALLRAPAELRLLGRGSFDDVQVEVTGKGGPVLQARLSGGIVAPAFASFFAEMPADFLPENVRDGALNATVTAQGFQGVLVLEAESFSLARPAGGAAAPAQGPAPFSFGKLPDKPVGFSVRSGTRHLYLWHEAGPGEASAARACGQAGNVSARKPCAEGPAAHVALFGPDDRRVATVDVPANGTVVIPVGAVASVGTWVAVVLDGEADLGADRAPGDLELHPLAVTHVRAPAAAAGGSDGSYGAAEEPVAPAGTPFAMDVVEVGSGPFDTPPPPMGTSCPPSALALRQGGETIGAWGFGLSSPQPSDGSDAARLLAAGPLTAWHDDFGPGCARLGLDVSSYQRAS